MLVDRVGQHQGSAAGSIQLVVVMLLHDLNVVVHTQNGRCTLAQLGQHVDAHGHVGALEHRNCAGQLHDLELQFFRKAGGAHHDGQLVGFAVGQSLFHSGRRAEVDDDITLAVQLFQAVVYRDTVLLAVLHVDTGDHAAVVALRDHLAQHMAHAAADALNHNFRHSFYPFPPQFSPRRIRQNARAGISAGHSRANEFIPG